MIRRLTLGPRLQVPTRLFKRSKNVYCALCTASTAVPFTYENRKDNKEKILRVSTVKEVEKGTGFYHLHAWLSKIRREFQQ